MSRHRRDLHIHTIGGHHFIFLVNFLMFCIYRYRFAEFYYRRSESVRKGRTIPARIETVVIYLPDVQTCVPTHIEWDELNIKYKGQLECAIKKFQTGNNEVGADAADGDNTGGKNTIAAADKPSGMDNSEKMSDTHDSNPNQNEKGVEVEQTTSNTEAVDDAKTMDQNTSNVEEALNYIFLLFRLSFIRLN